MIAIYDPEVTAHAGDVELTGGRFVPCFENPRRAEAVLEALRSSPHEQRPAARTQDDDSGLAPIRAVHDAEMVDLLRTAFDDWTRETGEHRDALPIAWPIGGMRRMIAKDSQPSATVARLGRYCFDAGTPITAGAWHSARASVDIAVTAVRAAVAENAPVFAACRPPGHHAGRDHFGGYCYVNQVAIAAQLARDELGIERVAILDVDDHHGNGTQDIFYERQDILTASLHGDPDVSYPYFIGRAQEVGAGVGEGYNINYPIERGGGWAPFEAALTDAFHRIDAFAPDLVLVPLGVDTFSEDPIGARVGLHSEDFRRLGQALARGLHGRRVVLSLEGGYAIEQLGENVLAVLDAFEG